MRFAASTRKLAPIYAQNNTRTPDDKSHAAIPIGSATGDSKTPFNYARTQAHQSSFKPPLHCGKKKRQTDPSRNRRTDQVPFIAGCSHFTQKNTRFRAPASSPKHSPMQHHAAITMRFAASTRKLAPIYAQNNTRTPDDKSHAAIPIGSATGDSKTPYNYAHTHKQTQSSFKPPLHCGKKKLQTDPSRNRRTDQVSFIAGCSHFTRKNTRFRAPASSPKHSPMQHHAAITIRFAASTRKLAPIYAQNNTRTPDDKSHAAIPIGSATGDSKTPYNYAHTHKQTQSSFKPPLHCGKKKPTNRPQP